MHLGDGRWWDEDIGQWRNGRGQTLRNLPPPDRWNRPIFTTRVILACAHLDHDPSNSRLGNSQLFASAVTSSTIGRSIGVGAG